MTIVGKFISAVLNFDNFILLYIQNNMHDPVMDKAMVIITSLGNVGAIWIVIAVLLIINKKYRKIGFMVLASLVISTILGEGIIKHIVKRLRPSAISSVNRLIAEPSSYSFPSGHTTTAFASAGILAKYFKNHAFVIFALASFIGFSRLYLYVHYPTDVLAGIILGLICSKATIYIFNKESKNMNPPCN
jgi:undecaprenyl-diphosphatase